MTAHVPFTLPITSQNHSITHICRRKPQNLACRPSMFKRTPGGVEKALRTYSDGLISSQILPSMHLYTKRCPPPFPHRSRFSRVYTHFRHSWAWRVCKPDSPVSYPSIGFCISYETVHVQHRSSSFFTYIACLWNNLSRLVSRRHSPYVKCPLASWTYTIPSFHPFLSKPYPIVVVSAHIEDVPWRISHTQKKKFHQYNTCASVRQ